MFDLKRRTQRFRTDDDAAMAEYQKIVNDPLCAILDRQTEKISEKDFDGEGNMMSLREYVVWVVTWDEKTLS